MANDVLGLKGGGGWVVMIVTVLKVPESNTSVTPREQFCHPQNFCLLASYTGLPLCIYCCIINYIIFTYTAWWLKPTHVSFLTVSVGQRCGYSLGECLWLKISHEVAVKVSAGTVISYKSSAVEEGEEGREILYQGHSHGWLFSCLCLSSLGLYSAPLPGGGKCQASNHLVFLVTSLTQRLSRDSSLSHLISLNSGVFLLWVTKDTPIIGKLQRF